MDMTQASECIDSRQRTGQPWNDMHPEALESMSSPRGEVRGMGSMLYKASKVFILTDENIAPFWLPEVEYGLNCEKAVEIVIKPGEQHKNLQTVQRIWKTLMKHHADRNALLINLGGGVITDLGGFSASTYKRGIKFINVPTTLLAMVDAAIGGKTGIDFGGAKNQIGTFAEAEDVLVDPVFLSPLPRREILSGMAGALWLSVKHCGLDTKVLKDYEKKLPMLLSEAEIALADADVEPIMDYLAHDKKNKGEKPQFVLLEAVGKPVWDAEIDVDTIEQSLEYVIGNVRCNY